MRNVGKQKLECACSWRDGEEFVRGPRVRYLCERLLAVVLQVLGVDIEVIVVDGERLRTLGYRRHKLLHLKEDVGLLTGLKLLHGNVG